MRLENVRVERFRSVFSAELSTFGQFNVAIGKNNSGKSALLTAIQTFYVCLSEGGVVALNPPIGKTIDFTSRDASKPITIELRFSISLAERDELLRNIALEAPQLKNAVDGLNPSLWLSACLNITSQPTQFAYLASLALVSPDGKQEDRTILKISEAAALELRTRFSNMQRARRDSERIAALAKRIDEDDWKRLRDGGAASNIPRSYLLRRLTDDLGGAVEQHLESLLREPGTFTEFKRSFKGAGEKLLEEARNQLAQPLRDSLDTFSGRESEVPHYVNSCLKLITDMSLLYLSERRTPLGKVEAQRLLSLKVRRGGNEALKNIQETVYALLGVHIDAFESAATSATEKGAELDVDDFLLEVNGAGIREALRLVLDVEFQHPSILLVEEPEVHLHPALEIAMMRYLKQLSVTCQVFVSTHSTNFLDAGDLRNVYLVSKDRFTTVQLLNLEDAQSIIPKELGLRLSSLFMFDRLVFVEGPSDEAVIREFANKLEVNLAQRNVGFIRMGGVRNFTHYASEAILSFLSKRQVEMHFLLDHDEQDESQISSIRSRLGQKASVHVLRRREIENYLLEPRALTAFLEIKLQGAPRPQEVLSPQKIGELLGIGAEGLREFTVGKRLASHLCKPVFSSGDWVSDVGSLGAQGAIKVEIAKQLASIENRQARVIEIYDQESNALLPRWADEKLDIVPGSELLDKVFQHYGVRFRKETDSSRIAGAMTREEINGELVEFVKSIGR